MVRKDRKFMEEMWLASVYMRLWKETRREKQLDTERDRQNDGHGLFKARLILSLRADMISIFEDSFFFLIFFLIFFIRNHLTLANSLIIVAQQVRRRRSKLPYKVLHQVIFWYLMKVFIKDILSKHVFLVSSEVYSMYTSLDSKHCLIHQALIQ